MAAQVTATVRATRKLAPNEMHERRERVGAFKSQPHILMGDRSVPLIDWLSSALIQCALAAARSDLNIGRV